jgi:hypothetical protein
MVSKACYTRLWNRIKFGGDIQNLNISTLAECAFACVGSASDEIVSAFAQPAMKCIPRMLSLFWMMVLKWVVITPYADHVRKLVIRLLSMRKNGLLVGRACMKIGYSLAQHPKKLVNHLMSIRKKSICTTCIYRVFPLFPLSPLPLSPSPLPF